jgi:glutaredoxin-like protein NrdH
MSAAVLEAPAVAAEGADFTLEVYSKPSCVQCTAMYRKADKLGIVYSKPMMGADELREFGASLGLAQAPVNVVRDSEGTIVDSWGGFNPIKTEEWADRLPMTPEAAAKKAAELAAAEPLLAA